MTTFITTADAIYELERLGAMLEAADARKFKLPPRLYRQAAVRINVLLRAFWDCPQVHAACANQLALAEIRSGLLFEDDLALGTTTQLFDFSPFSGPQ